MYFEVSVQLWHFVMVSFECLIFCSKSSNLSISDYLAGLYMFLDLKRKQTEKNIGYLEREASNHS